MKKALLFFAIIFSISITSQEYSFGIESDYNTSGNPYEFTFVATPDFTNPDPNFADIQITIAITAGNTIEANSFSEILGSGWIVNTALTGSFLQTNFGIGDGSKDIWVFSLPVPTSALTTPHISGQGIAFLSFVVDNTPTSGTIEILANDDPIATGLSGVGFVVNNIINVDLNDGNGVMDYFGSFSPGASSFDFSVLNIEATSSISKLSIYPNPTSDILNVQGNTELIKEIQIFSITGQRVMQIENNFTTLNAKSLEAGIYFVKLNADHASKTIKLIKN